MELLLPILGTIGTCYVLLGTTRQIIFIKSRANDKGGSSGDGRRQRWVASKGGSSFVKLRPKLTKTEKPVWHALSVYDVRYGSDYPAKHKCYRNPGPWTASRRTWTGTAAPYVPGIYSAIATHNEQKHGQHLLQSTAMTISGFTTSDDEDDDHVVFVTQVVNKKAATVQYGTVLVVAHCSAPGSAGRAY